MKKITLASCLLIAIAVLFSARWGTKAVYAPPDGTLGTPDTASAYLFEQSAANSGTIIPVHKWRSDIQPEDRFQLPVRARCFASSTYPVTGLEKQLRRLHRFLMQSSQSVLNCHACLNTSPKHGAM